VRPIPLSTDAREKIVIHVGAIQERKNISRLIAAFESCSTDWRLVLAGSRGYGADKILDRIQSSPAKARIDVTGFVSNDALGRWYAKASLLAFPSLDEGFGMPVLEAMASGVPVMCSRTSALLEVAGEAAFLVDPLSVEDIQTALTLLTENESLRQSLISSGKTRATAFSWERAVRRTWDVYQELL
jgi:glycosyltransferase involved in cell wall biosynthesis